MWNKDYKNKFAITIFGEEDILVDLVSIGLKSEQACNSMLGIT
jgi:hypothetical protein